MGNVPLITPWAAAGAGAQPARLPRGAALWGRPRRQVLVLSGIRKQPEILLGQTRALPVEPCPSAAGRRGLCWETSGWACEDVEWRDDGCPLLGTLRGRAALLAWTSWEPGGGTYLPGAGAWGFPPELPWNPAHATTFSPSVCPAFQLNPNHKWV